MKTASRTPPSIVKEGGTFIGIDYHKKHSVWHAVDAAGNDLGKGRIEHHSPHDFATLVKRWPHPRVVFEASMNWHWLYEELEQHKPADRLTLANPFKTRIIAEAQVKTDSRPKGDSQPKAARRASAARQHRRTHPCPTVACGPHQQPPHPLQADTPVQKGLEAALLLRASARHTAQPHPPPARTTTRF